MTERCASTHEGPEIVEATGRVRSVSGWTGAESITPPLCDPCQVAKCLELRPLERTGELRQVGAVPLDYRERMAHARNRGKIRRALERRTDADVIQRPASVDEVADEIARFVLELEESGVARELLIKLSVRLVAARQEREGW